MRKSLAKLVLRKETVQVLSGMDLARVIGGQDTDETELVRETLPKQCPAPVVAPQRG